MLQHDSQGRGWFRSRTGLALLGFLTIASFFRVAEHRAHLFAILPYLLLLACPLLHLLMHRKHCGHGKGTGDHPEDHPGHYEHPPERKGK